MSACRLTRSRAETARLPIVADSVLVWPVTRFDTDVVRRWGVQTEACAVFPTADVVRAVCDDLQWPLLESMIAYRFGRHSYTTWVGTFLPDEQFGTGCTRIALAETSYRFELGSLAAALTLTRAIAEKCGPQVLAFTSGGAHVVVGADTSLADVKSAFAVAHETALVL